jgi:signal transduction histidine kinase
MTDKRRIVIGRSMALVAVLAAVVGIVWLGVIGLGAILWTDWIIHNGVIAVGSGLIVWLVLPSQPRNGAIWVFAWAGFFTGLLCLAYAMTGQSLRNLGIDTPVLDLVPADLPLRTALLAMNINWLWVPVLLPFTLGLLLFPDGELPSKRWRWVFWAVIAVFAATCIGLMWEGRPSSTIQLVESQDTNGGFRTVGASLVTVGYIGIFVTIPFCVSALVVQFRRSSGERRQQFRWVVFGAAVAGVALVSALVFDELLGKLEVSLAIGLVGMAVLLTSFGIAIGKFRLYDIDVVISRTFVYGSLAVFITGLYVGIVVGVGYLLGAHDEPNPWLGLAATVVVAIAFQPVRRALERVANRVVYGRRATPYEVLSTFSQRVAAVDPEVIGLIARSLGEGTTAKSVSIWVKRGSEMHRYANWPDEAPGDSPHGDRTATVIHDGEELGVVSLVLEPGQPFTAIDERLLNQVAGGLGLALRNLLLTEDLRARVDQLRESRRRIVDVQDQTRRELERDLHDGAQQRLVALKIKLGIGVAMARKVGADDVGSVLEGVQAETDQTIESVRDFARGIYPPLLEAEGLGAALNGQVRKLPLPATIQAAGIGRYPRNIEATVYFCVLEALQNVVKHAQASSAVVTLTSDGNGLSFEVRDDGNGFDQGDRGQFSGLTNIQDRVDAVGGSMVLMSELGRGTVVRGTVPADDVVLVS